MPKKIQETSSSSEEAEEFEDEKKDDELNKTINQTDTIKNQKHIMISYQWHYQKLMLRVCFEFKHMVFISNIQLCF